MSAANVKLNHALSPEPSQNVKGDSIETSVANEPIHVNNTVIVIVCVTTKCLYTGLALCVSTLAGYTSDGTYYSSV